MKNIATTMVLTGLHLCAILISRAMKNISLRMESIDDGRFLSIARVDRTPPSRRDGSPYSFLNRRLWIRLFDNSTVTPDYMPKGGESVYVH